MLSRVASSVYWMTRYLERADNVARFIDVNAQMILDRHRAGDRPQWEPMIHVTGDDAAFRELYGAYDEKSVIRFLTFDDRNPNSILSCVNAARENARTVREIISSEMWEVLNALYHLVGQYGRKRGALDMERFVEDVHVANHLFTGHMYNTMSNGEGWQFARTGRMIERADKTARMLDIKYILLLPEGEYVGSVYDSVEWGAVLKSVSGFEMYQKQFHIPNYRDITDFLVLDPDFPRSIRFCVNTATRSLETITAGLGMEDAPALLAARKLAAALEATDIAAILAGGLHDFVDELQRDLNAVDDAIFRSFFSIEKFTQGGK